MTSINQLVNLLRPISLKEMDEVSLLKRMDTKFILTTKQLSKVLENIGDCYSVLEINNQRIMGYNTIYYDTPKFDFYLEHHNQRKNRYKVRTRTYLNGNLSFLEIKFKSNKNATIKSREMVDLSCFNIKTNPLVQNTIQNSLDLHPILSNQFQRFTLVDNFKTERVTIDLELSFNNKVWQSDLVVLELKQPKLNRKSVIFQELKKLSIHESSFSKYCMGLVWLNAEVKKNNFKPSLNKINKLIAS